MHEIVVDSENSVYLIEDDGLRIFSNESYQAFEDFFYKYVMSLEDTGLNVHVGCSELEKCVDDILEIKRKKNGN